MDRRTRPADTRRRAAFRLTRGSALLIAVVIAGCGGNSYVQFSSSGSPATGVSTGSSVYVQGSSSGSTFGYVIAILTLGHLLSSGYLEQQPFGSSYPASPVMTLGPNIPVPELEPSRSVNEQDCSKPIENWSANLKCK